MKPIFSARTRFSSLGEMSATFSSLSQISPELGRSRQPIKLTNVDFPEPDGPMIAIHSPGSTSSEKLSRARMMPPLASARAGYSRLTFLSLIISLASQDHSGLHAPEEKNRKHGGNQGHGNAAHENGRQDVEARHYRRVKVNPADPGGNSHADSESADRADGTQSGGFGGEESSDEAFGSAQGLHDGKVAASVKYPSNQCREHAQSRSRDYENSGGGQCGASFSQHARFSFHDLTYGTDICSGESLR